MEKVVPKDGSSLRPQAQRGKQTIALPSAAEVLSNDTWLYPHLHSLIKFEGSNDLSLVPDIKC